MHSDNTQESIQYLRSRYPQKDRSHVAHLAAWSRFAVADYVLYDMNNAEICERYGVSESRWQRHKNSVEGKEYAERLRSISEDPAAVARLSLAAEGNHNARKLLAMAQALEDSGDFKNAGSLYAKALEYGGVPQPKRDSAMPSLQAGTVILNFSPSQTEALREAIPEAKWQIASNST